MMWSALRSEAPHSQFGDGAAPHLYMDEWNRPTPVRRRFSFTQDVLGKPIPRGLGLALGIKVRPFYASERLRTGPGNKSMKPMTLNLVLTASLLDAQH